MTHGAIFDFNGTMILDGPYQEEAWRTWARNNLGLELSDEDFAYHLHGVSIGECLEFMLGRWPAPDETDAAELEREQLYRDLCRIHSDACQLAEGLPGFLDALADLGVRITIATASPLENMEFHFERLGLDRWFSLDTIVYNDRTFPSKPAPDIFVRAMDRIGVPAACCTVFEDAPLGLEAARRAGAGRVVAVTAEYDPEFLVGLPGVDRVIADYRDTEGLLATVLATTDADEA